MRTQRRFTRPAAGLALAALSAVAFGTVAPLAKIGYNAGAGPFPLLAVRFSVAAVLLAIGHRIIKRSLNVGRPTIVRLMLLGALGFAFESSLFFAALERAPAGLVTLVFYAYPLITTVIAFGLKLEEFRRSTLLALALGSVGVASIFSIQGVNVAGLLLAAGAAAAVAVYFTVAGIVAKGIDPGTGATWTAAGAALATAIAWAVSGQSLPQAALLSGGSLGVVTALAFLTLYGALALIGPSRTTVAQMLEPVVTVTIAAIFLDERITFRVALGALLIVSALPILAASDRREEVLAPPDSI